MSKLAFAFVGCVAGSAALGDVVYLTDSRTIRATALANGLAAPPQSDSATGPVFNNTVSTSVHESAGPGFASSSASQHSELLGDRITGVSGGSGRFTRGNGSAGGYAAAGNSDMDVTFHLTSATPFSVVASATASTGFPSVGNIFTLSGGDLPAALVMNGSGPLSLNTGGVLGEGDYHLVAHSGHNQAGAFGEQDYDFNFTVMIPAPGTGMVGLMVLVGAARGRPRR